jgi:hypothetical protein
MDDLPRTSMPAILAQIRGRLRTVLRFPQERVLPDARDDDESEGPTKADQYVLIRVSPGRVVKASFVGTGRVASRMERDITVTLWTRLAADEQRSDAEWLSHPSIGHLQAEHKLWDALLGFQPVDDDGDWIVAAPIVPESVDAPKKARRRKGWGHSSVRFTVEFVLDLDQTYQ